MLKMLITAFLSFFIGVVNAQVLPIVDPSFKTKVPTLKAESAGPQLAYLTAVAFNLNALQNYTVTSKYPYNRNRISLGANEQCVALIQAVSNAGRTDDWRKGDPITSVTPPYSVIATFTKTTERGPNTGYTGTDGRSHAAIYIGKDSNGIYILDQNFVITDGNQNQGSLALRYLPTSGNNQNNADNYYLVEKLF